MSDDERPKRKRLGRYLDAGQRQGAFLKARGNPTFAPHDAHRRELRGVLDEAESRLAQSQGLWEREWVATAVRGVRRTVTAEQQDQPLRARCAALEARLLELDEAEFAPLRSQLRAGTYRPQDLLARFAAGPHEADAFAQRLFSVDRVPDATQVRQAKFVHYIPTAVDAVLDIVAQLHSDDVFYDIGSGLGLVTMMVHFLSDAVAKGVEYEPAYVTHARRLAADLGFEAIEYRGGDARHENYDDATVFYLYDSFREEILEEMIAVIKAHADARPIRVFSRGESTPEFAQLPWLDRTQSFSSGLSVFASQP